MKKIWKKIKKFFMSAPLIMTKDMEIDLSNLKSKTKAELEKNIDAVARDPRHIGAPERDLLLRLPVTRVRDLWKRRLRQSVPRLQG